MGCLHDCGMRREPEIIIRAQIERSRAAVHANARVLRRGDHALALVGARGADLVQLPRQVFFHRAKHNPWWFHSSDQFRITLPDLPEVMAWKPFSNSV